MCSERRVGYKRSGSGAYYPLLWAGRQGGNNVVLGGRFIFVFLFLCFGDACLLPVAFNSVDLFLYFIFESY